MPGSELTSLYVCTLASVRLKMLPDCSKLGRGNVSLLQLEKKTYAHVHKVLSLLKNKEN